MLLSNSSERANSCHLSVYVTAAASVTAVKSSTEQKTIYFHKDTVNNILLSSFLAKGDLWLSVCIAYRVCLSVLHLQYQRRPGKRRWCLAAHTRGPVAKHSMNTMSNDISL